MAACSGLGSSGSVKAVEQALITCKLSTRGISADNLRKLKELVIDAGKVSALNKFGIRKDRVSIFQRAWPFLTAAFEVLGIEQMDFVTVLCVKVYSTTWSVGISMKMFANAPSTACRNVTGSIVTRLPT